MTDIKGSGGLCRNCAWLALGMGMERPGTRRYASAYRYWNCSNLQIQDHEAIFPRNPSRVSKGT
jgi:hypothetical protein